MDVRAIESVLEKSMLASGAPVSSSAAPQASVLSSRRSGTPPPSAGTNAFAVRSSAAVAAGVVHSDDVTALKGRDAPRAHGVRVRGASVVVDVDTDAADEKVPHLEVRCFSLSLSLSLALTFSLSLSLSLSFSTTHSRSLSLSLSLSLIMEREYVLNTHVIHLIIYMCEMIP